MFSRKFIPFAVFSLVTILLVQASGCEKEYSYEGGINDSTVQVPIQDSTILPPVSFTIPPCLLCKDRDDDPSLWEWNFNYNGSVFCGIVDTAIMNAERTGFTFFGSSSCSSDTGIVVTVYLGAPLKNDTVNVYSSHASFYYYDNVKPSYIFMSGQPLPFSLKIDTYSRLTGIATGTFTGSALTEGNEVKQINAGKFSIRLE